MLTREEFNNALWTQFGPDQLKSIVDGVKADVGNAFGLTQTAPRVASAGAPTWGRQETNPDWGSVGPTGDPTGPTGGVSVGRAPGTVPPRSDNPARDAFNEWYHSFDQTPREPFRDYLGEMVQERTAPAASVAVRDPLMQEWDMARENVRTNREATYGVPQAQNASFTQQPVGSGQVASTDIAPSTAVAVSTPVDAWAQEFYNVHGREPGSYDAMVRDQMVARMEPGQIPTRGDWEQLTRDLNSGRLTGEPVYGPRDVPDFVPMEQRVPRTVATSTPTTPAQQTAAPRPQTIQAIAPERAASVGLSQGYATYKPIIEEHAAKYGVDPNLVASLIQQESGFNANASGAAGEVGMMQIMPPTAAGLGLTADSYFDPRSNIDAGTKYLASQMAEYKDQGDAQPYFAIAAYNMGGANLNAVLRGEMVMPESTRAYVKAIMDRYDTLKAGR